MNYIRIALPTIALLILATSFFAQGDPSGPPPKRFFNHGTDVFEGYVADAGAVLVKSKPMVVVRRGDSEVELTAEFSCHGNEVTRPDFILLGFISHSGTPKYDASTRLILKADGNSIGFDTTRLKIFALKDSVIEMLFTPIPYNVFLRIANAKTVEASLDKTNLKLEESHLEVLRDVASRTTPHRLSL